MNLIKKKGCFYTIWLSLNIDWELEAKGSFLFLSYGNWWYLKWLLELFEEYSFKFEWCALFDFSNQFCFSWDREPTYDLVEIEQIVL